MAEIDDAIARLNRVAANQTETSRRLTNNVASHRTRLTTVEATVTTHGDRLDTHDTHFGTIDQAVSAMTDSIEGLDATTDLLRVGHESNATRIDAIDTTIDDHCGQLGTHTAQIATHDEWFTDIWKRLGPKMALKWGEILVISLVAFLSTPLWYSFVFEQYGLGQKFVDPAKGIEIIVPANPAKMWLVSLAFAAVTYFVLAFLLSFISSKAKSAATPPAQGNTTQATAPLPQPATTAPVPPTLEFPPAPAPAPSPGIRV